ncbi:MAG TPA: Ig-like domain-containing protein [Candidatus Woesebacteria bacterium]|nr:Ig-like domain-containing protein [Candidatus Woesebacteria bacterium]
MKKYIIILLILIIAVILGLLIFFFRSNNQEEHVNINEPTGIIIPTQQIQNNVLDIVQINPSDKSTNISNNQSITITFSKSFSENEIEFFISPSTEYTSSIDNNKLIIKPVNSWQTGMKYTYSVNFINDNQKVRLYSFITAGEPKEYEPDTQPVGLYEQQLNNQKNNTPDLYVSNNTPYENNYFLATSEYASDPPAHFYLIIIPKDDNISQVQQAVTLWLQSLDLSQEQIDSLDIRYQ